MAAMLDLCKFHRLGMRIFFVNGHILLKHTPGPSKTPESMSPGGDAVKLWLADGLLL